MGPILTHPTSHWSLVTAKLTNHLHNLNLNLIIISLSIDISHWLFFTRPPQDLFWAYFGHFSGFQRLILTHPTSRSTYIMPLGSDTSVGTFPGTDYRDEKPFRGSLRPLTWSYSLGRFKWDSFSLGPFLNLNLFTCVRATFKCACDKRRTASVCQGKPLRKVHETKQIWLRARLIG